MNQSQIKSILLQNFDISEKEIDCFIVEVGIRHLGELTGVDILEEFDAWLFEKMQIRDLVLT